jgi:hypothetical protein
VFLEEKDCSIFNVGANWKDGQVINSVELQGKSELRLVRKDAVRCDMFLLYFHVWLVKQHQM